MFYFVIAPLWPRGNVFLSCLVLSVGVDYTPRPCVDVFLLLIVQRHGEEGGIIILVVTIITTTTTIIIIFNFLGWVLSFRVGGRVS